MGERILLQNGDCQVTVSPAGGALIDARLGAVPLLQPTATPGLASRLHGREACFPMVPFGNRLEHNRFNHAGTEYRLQPNTPDPFYLHGDGWLSEWMVTQRSDGAVTLDLARAADGRSPYAYRAEERVEVGRDGLSLSLAVQNQSIAALPFGLGFHPYLPVYPQTQITFQAGSVWSERAGHLPDRPLPLSAPLDFSTAQPVPDVFVNNAFEGWAGAVQLAQPDGKTIRLTASDNLTWLMLYKPDGPSDFLCLEPMSHRPNGFHGPDAGGLVTLEPGEWLRVSMQISLMQADGEPV